MKLQLTRSLHPNGFFRGSAAKWAGALLPSFLLPSLLLLGVMVKAAVAQQGVLSSTALVAAALSESASLTTSVADGAYLFGESEQPGELGKEYMIFEVNQGEIKGAFFSPSSDFSCFKGAIADEMMSLMVEDETTQTLTAISVPLYLSNEVAASEMFFPFESALGLQGTYRIAKVDSISLSLLETCKAEL